MKTTTITIEPQTLEMGRKQAERLGYSFSAWVNKLINSAVRRSPLDRMQELMALADQHAGDSNGKRWTSDEIYDR